MIFQYVVNMEYIFQYKTNSELKVSAFPRSSGTKSPFLGRSDCLNTGVGQVFNLPYINVMRAKGYQPDHSRLMQEV